MPSDNIQEDIITKVEEGGGGPRFTKVEERGGVSMLNSDADGGNFCSSWTNSTQKVVAEVVGTYFVVFAGCGSVAVNKMYGSVTFPGICVTWGLIVMVLIYTLGHVSGAHFNPAVTITNAVFGRMPYREVPMYVTAQLLGAVFGSGTLRLALNPKPEHFFGTVPVGSNTQSLVFEIVITFLLMFVISSVGTDNRAIGELGGIAIGSTILLNVFVAGPISGASMNPARTLGPAIILNNYKSVWVYVVGPLVGALAGAFVYNLLKSDNLQAETSEAASFFSKGC